MKMPRPIVVGITLNQPLDYFLGETNRPPSDLGWLKLPSFQRPFVWHERQQVRFIESIFLGLDLGRFCYTKTFKGDEFDALLLDGMLCCSMGSNG
jgi:uncharacterized protein with ParB-like and HNH nuclease domain